MTNDPTSNAPALAQLPQPREAGRADWRWVAAGTLTIFLAVFAVYWRALRGQFLWDDLLVVHRNPLVTGELGLGAIWFHMDFPLTYAAFWLEWLAWGNHPAGYHVVNVLLHATGGVLLWRVLARLRVPASWLAAMLFAVHPVCVASVAWISELKNTLSLPFFLLSLLWYLRSDCQLHGSAPAGHQPSTINHQLPFYWLSLGAFVLALLSKTSTVMLPVVLLGCAWWLRGRIRWQDWLRTSPFFLVALAFGVMSIWFQAHGAISGATVQSEHFWGRLAGAGMALWFYLGKALLPLNLCMIYPRWKIDAAAPGSYLPLLLWCAVLAVCWGLRRSWGRHVLFGLGCFTVTLFPVLGFFDMYYLALSRVSDHFEYLPLTALVALAAAGLACLFKGRITDSRPASGEAWNLPKPLSKSGVSSPLTPALSLGERENHPPRCDKSRHSDDPSDGLRSTLSLRERAGVRGNWAYAVFMAGGPLVAGLAVLAALRAPVFLSEEALWRDTLAKNSAAWCAHANLGWILASQQKYDEAREHLEASLALKPDNAQAHSNLGRLLSLQGQFADAEGHFLTAVKLKPKDAEIRRAYASALAEQGRKDEAVTQLRELLQFKPDAQARVQLAALLYQAAQYREAVAEYRQALGIKPDQPEVLNNLAWLLATSPDGAVRNGADAVRFAEQSCRLTGYQQARSVGTLAAAYAEAGRFPEAVAMAQKAIELARAGGDPGFAAVNEQLLGLYRAGRPYHESPPTVRRPDAQ